RMTEAGAIQHQAPVWAIHSDNAVGFAVGGVGQDGFQGLDGRDGLAVGGKVVVREFLDFGEPSGSARCVAAEFDVGQLASKTLDHLDPVAALRSLSPR